MSIVKMSLTTVQYKDELYWLGTFGLVDECSTTELTLTLLLVCFLCNLLAHGTGPFSFTTRVLSKVKVNNTDLMTQPTLPLVSSAPTPQADFQRTCARIGSRICLCLIFVKTRLPILDIFNILELTGIG